MMIINNDHPALIIIYEHMKSTWTYTEPSIQLTNKCPFHCPLSINDRSWLFWKHHNLVNLIYLFSLYCVYIIMICTVHYIRWIGGLLWYYLTYFSNEFSPIRTSCTKYFWHLLRVWRLCLPVKGRNLEGERRGRTSGMLVSSEIITWSGLYFNQKHIHCNYLNAIQSGCYDWIWDET